MTSLNCQIIQYYREFIRNSIHDWRDEEKQVGHCQSFFWLKNCRQTTKKKNRFQVDIIMHYYLVRLRIVKISNYRAEGTVRRDATVRGVWVVAHQQLQQWWREVAFNQITIPIRNFHMNMVVRADVTVVCYGSMSKW